MTISPPIPDFKTARQLAKVSCLVRIVPEPKAFVLPVAWKETAAEIIPISVPANQPRQTAAH